MIYSTEGQNIFRLEWKAISKLENVQRIKRMIIMILIKRKPKIILTMKELGWISN